MFCEDGKMYGLYIISLVRYLDYIKLKNHQLRFDMYSHAHTKLSSTWTLVICVAVHVTIWLTTSPIMKNSVLIKFPYHYNDIKSQHLVSW